jgi:hypothetical protein
MARITDSELVVILERAFTRSRSDDGTNRADVEIAAVAAATVVRALRDAGLLVIREERRPRLTENRLAGAETSWR